MNFELVFIDLFLLRLVTFFLVIKLYFSMKNKATLYLVFASSVYALSAGIRVFSNLYFYIGVISAVLAIIGLSYIVAFVLSYGYKILYKALAFFNIITSIFVILLYIYYYPLSSICVFIAQMVILVVSIVMVLKKYKHFKIILGANHSWFLSILINGVLVLGIYIFGVIFERDIATLTNLLTFVSSLMISVFFVQFEYIAQNRRIAKANKQLQEEITKQVELKMRLDSMIANISDVISIVDDNKIITYVSPNVEKFFGWKPEELINKDVFITVHPDDALYIHSEQEKLQKQYGLSKTVEYRYMCKDEGYKYVQLTATNQLKNPNINGLLLSYHDINDRKRLEQENIKISAHQNQQQRLESIGTLASGVAHEINNPINGIMNYGQIIVDSSDSKSEISEIAKEIINESNRIAIIVKTLLNFSRDEKQEYSHSNIKDIIERTLSLIKTVMRHDQINLQIDIPEDLPKLKCRSQQIQQVIMNLLTNARDALNEKYEGYHEDKKMIIKCRQFSKEGQRWI